jgi:hypothetical protein
MNGNVLTYASSSPTADNPESFPLRKSLLGITMIYDNVAIHAKKFTALFHHIAWVYIPILLSREI